MTTDDFPRSAIAFGFRGLGNHVVIVELDLFLPIPVDYYGRMSGFLWGDEALDADLDRVGEYLAGEAERAEDFVGPDIAGVLSREGKLIRPALVILSGRLVSANGINLIPLAAAIEMIHLATLIHDDIIDGAFFRRGVPALHINAGGARAVLAGDWLLARALSIAGDYHTTGLFAFLSARIEELCRSEILQDASSGNLRVSREDYLRRIDGKTSALLRLACRAGAESSGADRATLEILDAWALTVGRAFQMDDDALDYLGRPGHMGKGISVDLRSGLTTLPLIIACETLDPLMIRLTRPTSVPGWLRRRRIRRRVVSLGSAVSARDEAGEMYALARNHAADLPGTGPADFSAVVDKLEGRAR